MSEQGVLQLFLTCGLCPRGIERPVQLGRMEVHLTLGVKACHAMQQLHSYTHPQRFFHILVLFGVPIHTYICITTRAI